MNTIQPDFMKAILIKGKCNICLIILEKLRVCKIEFR